ncbi:MAG: flagellar export chaperone FliS [Proteobacteria bacterium]|nr:flagellar export chaperone FliS [Pseudomonadota bacterium]MCP4921713.1 flagellar export chaperone FliS [Pseudomonadota bacterium]
MRGIRRYKQVGVQSASNGQVLVMLMRGSVLRLEDAAEDMADDRKAAVASLQKVRAVYGELLASLDATETPELGSQLRRLYTWAIRELASAERTGDVEKINAVKGVTQTLLEAWEGAVG